MSDYQPRTRERVIEILDAQDSNRRSWQQEAIAFLKRPAEQEGGYVLVPKEPTVEMSNAGKKAVERWGPQAVEAIYNSMLAAAKPSS